MKEPLGEGIRTLIRDSKVHKEVERVSLLGRAATIATLHDGDTRVQIRLVHRRRHELVEVARLEPEFQDAVPNRVKGLVALRVAEVCEAGEDPVKPLPLVVNTPGCSRFAQMAPAGQ